MRTELTEIIKKMPVSHKKYLLKQMEKAFSAHNKAEAAYYACQDMTKKVSLGVEWMDTLETGVVAVYLTRNAKPTQTVEEIDSKVKAFREEKKRNEWQHPYVILKQHLQKEGQTVDDNEFELRMRACENALLIFINGTQKTRREFLQAVQNGNRTQRVQARVAERVRE